MFDVDYILSYCGMWINIKGTLGLSSLGNVEVESTCTVKELKQIYYEVHSSMSMNRFAFVANCNPLIDSLSLADNLVKEGHTIYIILLLEDSVMFKLSYSGYSPTFFNCNIYKPLSKLLDNIEEKFVVPPKEQVLIIEGNPLDTTVDTLESAGITDGVLQLKLQRRSKAKSARF